MEEKYPAGDGILPILRTNARMWKCKYVIIDEFSAEREQRCQMMTANET